MIGFEAQGLLWLAVACLFLGWRFARVQRRALDWVEARVAPRFRGLLTVYGRASLRFHLTLLLAMALVLVVAAAGPFSRGKTETVMATGRLLLLIDGSASMFATDLARPAADPGDASNEGGDYRRLDYARHVALSLTRELDEFRFALGSFSGTSVLHLPMTADLPLIEDALGVLEVHSYYRNTGSSFARALDLVPHFVDRRGYRLQVVLLSDGESPVEEDYGAQLEALAEQDVPVHTVAIGTTAGQSRRILDFQDVVDKKENPKALLEYHTRRVDEHLKRISQATGGSFLVGGEGVPERLAAEILSAGLESQPFEHEAARADLSGRFLAAFLAAFVFDAVWFGRRPRGGAPRFELERLTRSLHSPPARRPAGATSLGSARRTAVAALLATGVLSSCALPFASEERGGPRALAHRENERGIGRDGLRKHREARPHYERSIGYGVEPEIPAHNLARSVVLTGDYSEAHDLFQEALLLAPDLAEAHFNDGLTLYLWGRAERDPRDCELERTRELWSQALRRFSSARAVAGPDGEVGMHARVNRAALTEQLDEIDGLIVEPPAHCLSESSEAAGGGAGADDQDAESGGGTQGGQGESQQGEGQQGEGQPAEGGQGEEQAGENESEEGQPGDDQPGEGQKPEDQEGAGRGDLTEDELEQIREQLEHLAAQGREAGKYHRRTLPEQFRQSDWSNPDSAIWW